MSITEDVKTISQQMSQNFTDGVHFYLTDIILCDIISDLHFCYMKNTSDVIMIEVYNDHIRDKNGIGIPLLNFTISQIVGKRPLTEFCELAVENLLEYLKTVIFDTLTGRFVPAELANKINKSAVNIAKKNIFKSIGISVLDTTECCVCYENTITKTVCGHHLCFRCASQLKPVPPDDDDDDEYLDDVLCPICRQVCLFANTGGCVA